MRTDDQLALRLPAPSGFEQHAQIGIDIEQSDLSGSRHRRAPPQANPVRTRQAYTSEDNRRVDAEVTDQDADAARITPR
jgi:hypothetical protein